MRTFPYAERTERSLVPEEKATASAAAVKSHDVTGPLSSQTFVPYFQPMVELRTGRVSGLEMLARCHHQTQGLLLPSSFVPEAESGGWLGELMLHLATQAALDLQRLPSPISLSINISPLQLRDRHLPQQIQAVANVTGIPLGCLTLEITETAIAIDDPCCIATAKALKHMGCRLSLDDFGTGYSCLLHLQALPLDELKIDRQFVGSMLQCRESRKIVSAVIGLGQSLGLRTVAEGIENELQSDMLRWLGCDLGQGWLFGHPMPAWDLRHLPERPAGELKQARLFGSSEGSLDSPATRLAQLQAVYDTVPVGLAFLDKQLRYLNLNERMAQMNNCSVEEHLGRRVCDVLPQLFPQIEPFLRRALKGEVIHDVELLIRPPHGKPYMRWFSYQPALDHAGEVIGLCIAVSSRALS